MATSPLTVHTPKLAALFSQYVKSRPAKVWWQAAGQPVAGQHQGGQVGHGARSQPCRREGRPGELVAFQCDVHYLQGAGPELHCSAAGTLPVCVPNSNSSGCRTAPSQQSIVACELAHASGNVPDSWLPTSCSGSRGQWEAVDQQEKNTIKPSLPTSAKMSRAPARIAFHFTIQGDVPVLNDAPSGAPGGGAK